MKVMPDRPGYPSELPKDGIQEGLTSGEMKSFQ